jgi:hypothetical protein
MGEMTNMQNDVDSMIKFNRQLGDQEAARIAWRQASLHTVFAATRHVKRQSKDYSE